MSAKVFEGRLKYLSRKRYPVLTLSDALSRLYTDELPACATVITIDDGWYGTAKIMAPLLKRNNFPATLYLATYYLDKQTQVFNVAVDYVLWAAKRNEIDLHEVDPNLEGIYNISDPTRRTEATSRLIDYGETLGSAEARQSVLRRICEICHLSADKLESERLFSFMNAEEARLIAGDGIDIQLHTHRHVFPAENFAAAKKEISDNRIALKGISTCDLEHFCYPSGIYVERQLAWLNPLSIVSATTTKRGFNRRNVSKFELRRFLDSDAYSFLEFEAEMSGFFELIRRAGYSI